MSDTYRFKHKHLIDIKSLSKQDIEFILETAEKYVAKNRSRNKSSDILNGLCLMNLFFENSTRTRISFELAAKRMGADVINFSTESSSTKKGETLLDTTLTLNAMRPDFLVVRHSESGTAEMLSKKVGCSVINAGDGVSNHPTQALLDALTIKRRLGKFEGVKITICGDVKHSRVARSNIELLNKMGAKIRIAAPKQLLPEEADNFGVEVFDDLDKAAEGADIIMMLRLQKERMQTTLIQSEKEYFDQFGLDKETLEKAGSKTFVMHPGPINRGVEIDSDVADDLNKSLILEQVEMGVAVRQAILEILAQASH